MAQQASKIPLKTKNKNFALFISRTSGQPHDDLFKKIEGNKKFKQGTVS